MTLVSDDGEVSTRARCAVKNLNPKQPLWFHPEYFTNVLFLVLLKKKIRITYDSSKGGAFVVHRPGEDNMFFHCYSNGLHPIECNIS